MKGKCDDKVIMPEAKLFAMFVYIPRHSGPEAIDPTTMFVYIT